MTPSDLIREISKLSTVPAIQQRLEALAAEFETQHNAQNNNWQGALGNAELNWEASLQALRFDLEQETGHREARQQELLELIVRAQLDIEELKAREVGRDAST